VNDIHFQSLQHRIQPVVYRYAAGYRVRFMTVRYDHAREEEVHHFLETAWNQTNPPGAFVGYFVTEQYRESYQEEARTAEIVGSCAALAILLACLGLVGLTSITVLQRSKEIGIRKAVGATVTDMVAMLSAQYVRLILLANVAGWPIAYVVAEKWLQQFGYRINLDPLYFLAGGFATMVVALAAVGTHTIRTALANPVEALRHE